METSWFGFKNNCFVYQGCSSKNMVKSQEKIKKVIFKKETEILVIVDRL